MPWWAFLVYGGLGAGAIALVVSTAREKRRLRAELETFADAFPWVRRPLPRMPRASATGELCVTGALPRADGGLDHLAVRFVDGFRGSPSTTQVSVLVGDGPSLAHGYPWVTLIPASQFPASFAWQVGRGIETSDRGFDERYRTHLYARIGLGGAVLAHPSRFALPPELVRLLLHGRCAFALSYDGTFVHVSWHGHTITPADVHEAVAIARAFTPALPSVHATIRAA